MNWLSSTSNKSTISFHTQQTQTQIEKNNDLESQCEIHTNYDGWKFWICNKCKLSCPSRSTFIRHYRIHTGEKPFACPYCQYRANQKVNLNMHIVNKHKNLS